MLMQVYSFLRIWKGKHLVWCLVSCALISCAQPRTAPMTVDDAAIAAEQKQQRARAIASYFDDIRRLHAIGYRIRLAGAPWCGKTVRWSIGDSFFNARLIRFVFAKDSYPMREAAVSLTGTDDRVKIFQIVPGTPAHRAGLKAGDIYVSVDGWTVTRNETGPLFRRIGAGATSPDGHFSITVLRDGVEKKFRIKPEKICDYRVVVQRSEQLNAFADGKRILVTRRMMEFAETDDELAVVVGHEFAHNHMKHIDAQQQNQIAGALAGLLVDVLFAAGGVNTGGQFTGDLGRAGAQAYSRDFEAEADYVGAYITALAGFNIEKAPNFWRRMALRNSLAIDYSTTHPTTAYRAKALEKIIEEIEGKRKKGGPLTPNIPARNDEGKESSSTPEEQSE